MAKTGTTTWKPKTLIQSALRQIWLYSPLRAEALAQARFSRGKYKCARCGKLFPRDLLEIHHKHCEYDKDSYDSFIRYLFLGIKSYSPKTGLATLEDGSSRQLSEIASQNLEALCFDCHLQAHYSNKPPVDRPKSTRKRRS